MTSINLILRPSSRIGKHPASLCLRLIHARRTKTITLSGCSIYEDEWNKRKQCIIFPESNPDRKKYLEELEEKIAREQRIIIEYSEKLKRQGYHTVDELADMYREKKDFNKLLGYAESLARELESYGQDRTARAYRTAAKKLVHFNKGVDIPLDHINISLIKAFETYLKQKAKTPNTISFYMLILRAIYNKAVSTNRMAKSSSEKPFAGVFTGVAKTIKRALSQDELNYLYNLDSAGFIPKKEQNIREYTTKQNLYRTWRYFFFCFYARGMSFVDMAYLKKEDIHGEVIKYCRKKTGQLIEIRLTPEITYIIDSFAAETEGSPYVFPIIRNRNAKARLQYESALRLYNRRLKKLALMVGIKKNITSHVTRHTWASIGKKKNVPLRVLSECLGHTSENTTRIYLAHLDNTVLDNANEIVMSSISNRINKMINNRQYIGGNLFQ